MNSISVNIPKKNTNDFLQVLWYEFRERVGPVACQHFYYKTDNNEIYTYEVDWCVDELPFKVNLKFNNHTAKGIRSVVIEAIGIDSGDIDTEAESLIAKVILETSKIDLLKRYKKLTVKAPISSFYRFAGNYFLEKSNVAIACDAESDYIIFQINILNENQFTYLFADAVKKITSCLTLCTQQLIEYDGGSVDKSEKHNVRELLGGNIKAFCLDNDFVDYDEVIEGDKLHLISESDNILYKTLHLKDIENSVNRFAESIKLRKEVSENRFLNFFKVQYELLGYVSSIESLLDTSEKNILLECTNCGTQLEKPERKISAQFNSFVSSHSENAKPVENVMKALYGDRSKFVHAGKSLSSIGSIGMGAPFILDGKQHVSDLPSYYFNIHEFTGYLLRKSMMAE
jgi:hypothetical protein